MHSSFHTQTSFKYTYIPRVEALLDWDVWVKCLNSVLLNSKVTLLTMLKRYEKASLRKKNEGAGEMEERCQWSHIVGKTDFYKRLSTALRQNQNLVAPIYYLKYPTFNKKFRDMQRNKKGWPILEELYLKNYGWRFITLYRRWWSKSSPRRRNAKRQNVCLRRP